LLLSVNGGWTTPGRWRSREFAWNPSTNVRIPGHGDHRSEVMAIAIPK